MTEEIRLNLGCGHKVIPGWRNFDWAPPVEQVPEGILWETGDIRDLSRYADNSVEEILAANCIEHIGEYDVGPALQEWFRVLKPGGYLAVECPNLIKCCINFLQAATTGDPEIYHSYGILGIYGKQEKDGGKGQEHLWGHWPQDMKLRFKSVGFVGIKEELPLMKPDKAHVRDFRIVGRKPQSA
jgi:SAM-dependent methyltransferase